MQVETVEVVLPGGTVARVNASDLSEWRAQGARLAREPEHADGKGSSADPAEPSNGAANPEPLVATAPPAKKSGKKAHAESQGAAS